MEAGRAEDTPETLDTPGKRALYNNLKKSSKKVAEEAAEYLTGEDPELALTLAIDTAVKQARPDGWRGVRAREQVVKGALYSVLKDQDEVERIFKIIFQQREY